MGVFEYGQSAYMVRAPVLFYWVFEVNQKFDEQTGEYEIQKPQWNDDEFQIAQEIKDAAVKKEGHFAEDAQPYDTPVFGDVQSHDKIADAVYRDQGQQGVQKKQGGRRGCAEKGKDGGVEDDA
jgi:hypothetical protein